MVAGAEPVLCAPAVPPRAEGEATQARDEEIARAQRAAARANWPGTLTTRTQPDEGSAERLPAICSGGNGGATGAPAEPAFSRDPLTEEAARAERAAARANWPGKLAQLIEQPSPRLTADDLGIGLRGNAVEVRPTRDPLPPDVGPAGADNDPLLRSLLALHRGYMERTGPGEMVERHPHSGVAAEGQS